MAQPGAKPSRITLGEHFSEGTRLVWLRMKELGWSQARLARHIDRRAQTVHRWLYGDRRPDLESVLAMSKAPLNVGMSRWTEEPAEPFEPPATEAA